MEDNEEMVKKLLGVFLPLIAVVLMLGGIALYMDSCFVPAYKENAPVRPFAPPRTPADPIIQEDPKPEPMVEKELPPAIEPTQQQQKIEAALEEIDPETMSILADLESGEMGNLEAAMKLIKHMNDPSVVVIPHKKLRAVLIDELPGFTAGKASSSSTSLLGLKSASAQRTYTGTDENKQRIEVKVMDTASMKKMSAMASTPSPVVVVAATADIILF